MPVQKKSGNLLKAPHNMATFNVMTSNTVIKLPELILSAAKHDIKIIYIQEHRYYHSELEINIITMLINDGHLPFHLHGKTLSIVL